MFFGCNIIEVGDIEMGFVELLLLSVGLGMDAFAVSVCKGISMKKMNWKKVCIIGLYFGGFQALMPVLGYFLGSTFESVISNLDHWIAFGLLAIIGGNMIKDAFSKECDSFDDDVSFKTMIVLAIATSIDALAVGITFAFLKVKSNEKTVSNSLFCFFYRDYQRRCRRISGNRPVGRNKRFCQFGFARYSDYG